MRIVIFDRKPGTGFTQWLLMASWAIGCFIQRWFGPVDAYYGAASWDDALKWILTRPKPITSIQYWGHGSEGRVWLAQVSVPAEEWLKVRPQLADNPNVLLWFRTCSTFAGKAGHEFSRRLADGLNCVIAGHTRIIGLLQGGLHTRKPHTPASWPIEETELPGSKWPYLQKGNNTITCFATRIPEGW